MKTRTKSIGVKKVVNITMKNYYKNLFVAVLLESCFHQQMTPFDFVSKKQTKNRSFCPPKTCLNYKKKSKFRDDMSHPF